MLWREKFDRRLQAGVRDNFKQQGHWYQRQRTDEEPQDSSID